MEDPVAEIPQVIRALTQTPPSIQRATIERYFTPDASFIHPLCRTGSFNGSRWLIWCIYRWYKILSPKIEIAIESVAFDANNLLLYVSIRQIFKIWFLPFYSAPVRLTTVLQLVPEPEPESSVSKAKPKFLIKSQNDLYQITEIIKFGSLFRITWVFVLIAQFFATAACVVGAVLGGPVSWVEENMVGGNAGKPAQEVILG